MGEQNVLAFLLDCWINIATKCDVISKSTEGRRKKLSIIG